MNKSDKWFVAATAGRWQECGIDAAHRAGYPVLGIDGDEAASGLAKCDGRIVADIHDVDAVLTKLSSLDLDIGGCLSIVSDAGMPLAGAIQDAYQLVGPGKQIAKRLMDKGEQRTCWRDAAVEDRQFAVCGAVSSAKTIAATFDFPFIIKPVDSAGSRGVTRVNAQDQITAAIDHAFALSRNQRIIIEEFIAGTELAVEVFRDSGKTHILAVSEKTKVDGTSETVAAEYRTAVLSIEDAAELNRLITSALDALQYWDGVGHVEIMRTPSDQFCLIEVAGRGGGFMVFEKYVPLVSGIELADLAIRQAMGEAITVPRTSHRPCLLRFLPARSGKVIDWLGLEEANSISGVVADALVNRGDQFSVAATDGDRIAYILAAGESIEDAVERADRAEQLIHFSFQPV